ncbi:MAG: GH3 auxin-responsive promoter family protein [Synergistaceae bacterium]|nr:GH3 auxin-responsive promoter family protein [Synergistaceae bacterium]
MKKYEVSIITPLHNVPLDMFKASFQSMQAQTLGFENVEWVVVVHNSTEEYERQVQELLSGHDNVVVDILHNANHTPSSPRNRGLEIASGDYIGFLDGDDRYTPDCLKVALRHIKRSGADVCMFRREVELEYDSPFVPNEVVLWDQTREEIIVNRDTWDDKKIFCSLWGLVTHRLFKASYLRDKGIRFDESIDCAEDYVFMMEALWKAEKVCLLPQLIGYVYYVNSASILQSSASKGEGVILATARSFKRVLDYCLNYGIDLNALMHAFLRIVAGFMLTNKDISEGVRKEIFELMMPYAKMITPIPPTKVYSPKYLEDLNNLPKYFLTGEVEERFIGEGLLWYDERTVPETVLEFQKRTLYSVLENGCKSDYGQRYKFSQIGTLEGYRTRLPMTSYDTYQPMINLATRINEAYIFTDEDITSYTLSYGRVGVPKRLPITRKHLAPYLKEMERLLGGKKVFVMCESLPYRNPVRNLDKAYTNTLTGLLLSEFYGENMRVSLSRKRAEITTPFELLFPDEVMDFEYPRLFFALREKDITAIYAPNASIFLSNIQRLAKDWEQLCDDIEAGSISVLRKFPEDMRKRLNNRIAPNPARAKELRRIFSGIKDGNILKLVKDIWPSLVEVIADGTGSYTIYADIIRDNMRHVKFSNDFLATEEGFIARAVPNTDMYELALTANFYEFMPLSEQGKTLMAHELKVDGEYRVIVSGYSGLYRYTTNVLVRCEEITDCAVTISKLCPRDYDIDAMEGITEEAVYRAVQMFSRRTDIQVADYVFIYDDESESYSLVLEPAEFGDNFSKAAGMSQAVRDEIAEECAKILGTSRPLRILFNEPGTHALYTEATQYRRNILEDAVRPCHMTDNALESKFFQKLTV